MRFLLTGAILLFTVVVTSAIDKPVSFKPKDLVKLFDAKRNIIGNPHNSIRKRQSQACVQAYLEAQSSQFQECSELFADGDNATINDILEFCDNDDCFALMLRVLTDLESCEEEGDESIVSIVR